MDFTVMSQFISLSTAWILSKFSMFGLLGSIVVLPSSRALLSGEQPHAWELLHPRARASRHRGAERGRRCGRSGLTSLLSLE